MKRTKHDNPLRKTLRISITEGIFSQLYGTLAATGNSLITKLLILLNATPLHFSLMTAIGQMSQVFQPVGVAVMHNLSKRRRICIQITAVGRFLTFFTGAAILFANPHHGIWFVLCLLFVSAALTSIGGNIWIAWISDMVPSGFRGRFFSKRNQILLLAGLLAGYLVSFSVDLFDPRPKGLQQAFLNLTQLQNLFRPAWQSTYLMWIFVVGTMIGLIGLSILSRQPEKTVVPNPEPLWRKYRKPLKDKNFRRLLLFGIWWMLAIGIGSAFWGPFMLKKLQMSLFEMQLYGSLHIMSSLVAYRFWGRFIDKHGNKTAMYICLLLGGLNPMFWLFMTAQQHLVIWVEALISGFMWAGAGIVGTNFVLSIASKGEEQVYSGLYGAFGGLSMMLTTLLSGALFPKELTLHGLHLEPEQVIFGIGGLARWSTLIPLSFVIEHKAKSLRSLGLLLWQTIVNKSSNPKD